MTQSLSRDFIVAFYDAFVSRNPARIAPFLDDDVEWSISGPVDLIDFFGPRHGKAAVLELATAIGPRFMDIQRFEIEELLIQDERAVAFDRLHAIQCKSGRMIAYHCAHFMRFRDGRIVIFRAVCDSFDVAEQMFGHAIDLSHEGMRAAAGDVVVV